MSQSDTRPCGCKHGDPLPEHSRTRSTYSHWNGLPDQPRWHVAVTFDDDESPVRSEYIEGHGLPILQKLVERVIPDLLYGASPEPQTLKIEITEVPF